MLTRRRFLEATALTGASLPLMGFRGAGDGPIDAALFPGLDADALPWLGLAASLPDEHDYEARVEGRIPDGLRGVLYRNGPGLFERDGLRKRSILDGDGMIQAFRIGDDGVRYQNRYTRTEKFVEEEEDGAFRYATWTTQAPGGMFSNLFARRMANQAGVSTALKHGNLYAFDESSEPHELDPATLETRGLSTLGTDEDAAVFSAHSKTDGRNGEWLHFGLGYGRDIDLHLNHFHADGRLRSHRTVKLPRYCYLHDYFATERHLVFNVHPAEISIFRFLFGRSSLVGAMDWRPELGNLVMIVPREGDAEPILIETEASWMWHTLNAYERGGEIVADFVGYDGAEDFLGDDPWFMAVMEGRRGKASASSLRRYVIDPAARTLRQEVIASGTCEFPIVNPAHACHPHRYGYVVRNHEPGPFPHQVARVDTQTGASDVFDFGEAAFCGEPIFARAPGASYEAGSTDEPGWLLTQVYDSRTRKSFLAILDAEHVADGPVAIAHLRHHVPLSFHGWWAAA